jgi:hypothetical protein
MAIVKRPPESVNRSLSLGNPVSELLDDYCKFVDCTPDYVANFALRKTRARSRLQEVASIEERPWASGIAKRSA